MSSGHSLIIGIGNRFRSDDALGPLVVDELKACGLPAIEHSGEPAGLMDAWQGYDHVILVDAVFSGGEPGTIHYYDLTQKTLPADFAKPTSHAVGIAEAVEFARVLNKLPKKIEFYGVEGKAFGMREGELTPDVTKAMKEIVTQLSTKL